jgi:hypothetical protein
MCPIAGGYGLPFTTDSRIAADEYEEGVRLILRRNGGAEAHLLRAVDADPHFALPHAALAIVSQYSGEAAAAQASAQKARDLAESATGWEKRHVEALARGARGDVPGALDLIHEQIAEHPRDALLLSRFGFLLNASGRASRKEEAFALYESVAPSFGEDAWFLGSFSFQHNELYHFEAARSLAEKSYSLDPRSSDCAHSLAHNFFERGEADAGIGFLEGWLDGSDWQQQMAGHLNWHQTLFLLESGEYDRALAIFDRVLRPSVYPGGPRQPTLTDSASFLWRCLLLGITPPAGAVQEVSAYAQRDFARTGMIFADAHKAMAYALAHDGAACERLRLDLEQLLADSKLACGPVLLAVLQAARSLAGGDAESAVAAIEPYAHELVRVGGSRAQYEVLQDTYIVACLRAGRPEQAEPVLRERLRRRFASRDQRWLESLAPQPAAGV